MLSMVRAWRVTNRFSNHAAALVVATGAAAGCGAGAAALLSIGALSALVAGAELPLLLLLVLLGLLRRPRCGRAAGAAVVSSASC